MPDDRSDDAAALSTVERVADQLRNDVTAGCFAPGERIKDQDLASRYAVSRQTGREALRLVASEGLVSLRLHSGATVRTLTVDDVQDVYRVRLSLEPTAIQAGARAPQALYDSIAASVVRAEAAVDREDWVETSTASLRFHAGIVALLESRALSRFLDQQFALLRLAFWSTPIHSAAQAEWIPRDREILTLLLSGQRAQAASAMTQYLRESEEAVLDAYRSTAVRVEPVAVGR